MRPIWPATRDIFVTYDEPHCHEFALADHCQILLRVRDENGKPVTGARLEEHLARSGPDASDDFGRLFRSLKKGERIQGTLVKQGWEPALVSEICGPNGDEEVEKTIVLRKEER